jgi:hypothetical protein
METDLLVPIIAIVIGGLIVLVPIAGLTLRFALKPALDSFLRARGTFASTEEVRRLEERLAAVESELRLHAGSRSASIGTGRDG